MKRLLLGAALAWLIAVPAASARSVESHVKKSPGAATAFSILGTIGPLFVAVAMNSGSQSVGTTQEAVSFTLAASGVVFGPGLGHLYAGNSRQFLVGSGLRLGCAAGMVGLVAATWEVQSDTAEVLAVGGSMVYVFSMIHDIVTADNSARAYNRKHGLAATSIAPYAQLSPHGMGGGLRLTF